MNLEMGSKSFATFKDFFGLLKEVNDELTMYVDETGIQLRGMDPSHVAMVDAKILPELFEKFEPMVNDSLKMQKITVNLSEFCKFLDRIGGKEKATIEYSTTEARMVILAKKTGYTRRFTLPTLEPLDDEVPEPKIFFKAEGRILTQSVDRAIKDADLVSEHVKFVMTEAGMKINGVGDMGSASNEFDKDGDELLELKVEEEANATYTLSYLKDMFAGLKKLSDVVIIELSTDMPMKIKADAIQNIELTLFLAPCIGI